MDDGQRPFALAIKRWVKRLVQLFGSHAHGPGLQLEATRDGLDEWFFQFVQRSMMRRLAIRTDSQSGKKLIGWVGSYGIVDPPQSIAGGHQYRFAFLQAGALGWYRRPC